MSWRARTLRKLRRVADRTVWLKSIHDLPWTRPAGELNRRDDRFTEEMGREIDRVLKEAHEANKKGANLKHAILYGEPLYFEEWGI